MTIVYGLVSIGKNVLAEHTSTSATGNFPTVTRVLLAKIPPQDGRMGYLYDDYMFHYVVESGICYLCMSDEPNKHRIPYAFLQDMRDRFISQYGTEAPHQAIAFSYNEEFSGVIRDRMDFYNSDGADRTIDNIGAIKNQIDEVKDAMVQNISSVLERGEKIELLVSKTDELNQQAFRFESSSRNLRKAMYWRRIRNYVALTVGVGILIFILSAAVCGGVTYDRCRSS